MTDREHWEERATDYQRGYKLATEEWKAISATREHAAYNEGREDQKRRQERIAWLNLFLVVFVAILAGELFLALMSDIVRYIV